MTADRAEATPPEAPPAPTPARRRRFAAALAAFGLWVAFLAALAARSDPPPPVPGAKPGAEAPRGADRPGAPAR